ncbi:MAG: RDD family protein [Bacteroidota bacterium]|jgi:uncharacterized RDD family membrane protein YckC|nr:RDD family protein [Cytophagales bacterium]
MEQYAGFWKRFGAIIIDGIIIWVLQAFVFVPILGALGLGFFTTWKTCRAEILKQQWAWLEQSLLPLGQFGC